MKKHGAAPLSPGPVAVEVSLPGNTVVQASGGSSESFATGESMLCAVRSAGRTLDFAVREARDSGRRPHRFGQQRELAKQHPRSSSYFRPIGRSVRFENE